MKTKMWLVYYHTDGTSRDDCKVFNSMVVIADSKEQAYERYKEANEYYYNRPFDEYSRGHYMIAPLEVAFNDPNERIFDIESKNATRL